MAKPKPKQKFVPPPAKRKGKSKLSPVMAAKGKHKADAVLGKHDCSYHNI